ncbi:MAG: hypothetical protein J6X20_05825 [Bacteroidales bacterium]|nr:hypothetical protein [Bacteroidales bacterium]
MMAFLLYNAKVAVLIGVCYIFYRLLLSRETLHRLNRAVLVGTAVLSFVLPLLVVTVHVRGPAAEQDMTFVSVTETVRTGTATTGESVPPPLQDVPSARASLPEVGAAASSSELLSPPFVPSMPASPEKAGWRVPWLQTLLTALYFLGVAVVLAKVVLSVLSVLRIIRQGETVSVGPVCTTVVTDRDIAPFSWMRYIVFSRQDWVSDHRSIVLHEQAHIAMHHSADILVVDLLTAFQWFNPAIWMLRDDLRAVHEFEADDAVLRQGVAVRDYQLLLIRKAAAAAGYTIANNFSHSLLKGRIAMMLRPTSPVVRALRVLYVLPVVLLALAVGCKKIYDVSPESGHYEHNFKSYAQYVRAHTGYILSPVKGFEDYGVYGATWRASDAPTGPQWDAAGGQGAVCLVSRDRNCLIMYSDVQQDLDYLFKSPFVSSRQRIQKELASNLAGATGTAPSVHLGDYLYARRAADYQLARTPHDSVYFYTYPNGRSIRLSGGGLEQFQRQSLPYCMGIDIVSKQQSRIYFKVFFSEEGFAKKEAYIGKLMDSMVAWRDMERRSRENTAGMVKTGKKELSEILKPNSNKYAL